MGVDLIAAKLPSEMETVFSDEQGIAHLSLYIALV